MAKAKARLTELETLLSAKEEELKSTQSALTKAEASRAKLKQYLEAFREQAVNTTSIIAQYQELQKQHSDLQQQHALLQQQKQGQESRAKSVQQQPGGQEERLAALQRAHEQLQAGHARCLQELKDLRQQRQQERAASGAQQSQQGQAVQGVLSSKEAQELRELRRTVQELQAQLRVQQRRQEGIAVAGQDGAEGVSESTQGRSAAKQLQQSSAVPEQRVAERGLTPTAAAGRPADSVGDWQQQEGARRQQQDRERWQQEAAVRQEAERRLAEALTELGAARRAEESTSKQMEELRAQLQQLQALVGQHASALSRLGEAAARHDEVLARHSADGRERSAALQRHEAALAQHGGSLARHEQQLAGQAAALQDQGGRLSGLAAAVEGLQPRVVRLEGQAGGVEGRVAALAGQVHDVLRTHSVLRRAFGAAGEVEDAGPGPVGLGEWMPAGGAQQPPLALPAPQRQAHRWEDGERRERGADATQHTTPPAQPAVSPPRNGTHSGPLGDQVAPSHLEPLAHVRQEHAPPAPGADGEQHPSTDPSQHRNKRRRLAAEQPAACGPGPPADPPAGAPSPPTSSPLLPLLPGPPPPPQPAPQSPQARTAVQSPASGRCAAVSWQQRLFHSDVGQVLSQPHLTTHPAGVQGSAGGLLQEPKRGPGRPRKARPPSDYLSTLLSTRVAHPSQLHKMSAAAARRMGEALQARTMQPGAAAVTVCDGLLRCCKPAVGPDQQGEGQASRAGGKPVAGDAALQHEGEAAEGGAAGDGLDIEEGLPGQGPGGRRRGGREEGAAGGKGRQREAGTGGGLEDELSALWCSPLPRRQQLVNALVECVWCTDAAAGPGRGLGLSSSKAHVGEAVPPAGLQHSQGQEGQPVEQQQQTRSPHGAAARAGGWRLGSLVARQLHAHVCVGDGAGRVTASGARARAAGALPAPGPSPAGAGLSERCAAAHALGELCKQYRDGGAFRSVLLDLLHTAVAGGQAAGGAAGPPHPQPTPSSASAAPTPAEDAAQRPAVRAPIAAPSGSLLPLACLVAAWPAGLSASLPAAASPGAIPAQAPPSGDTHAPPPLPASATAHDVIPGTCLSPSWPPTRELQLVADPVAVAAQATAQALALARLRHVAGAGRQGHGPAQAGGGPAPAGAAGLGAAGPPNLAVEASAATALLRAAVEAAGAYALPGAKDVLQAASGQEPLVPLLHRSLHEVHCHVEELAARLLGLLRAACCHVSAPAYRQQEAPPPLQPGCQAASRAYSAPMRLGSGSPALGGYCQALLLVCHVLPPAAVYDRVLRVLAHWLLDVGPREHEEGESDGHGRRVRERVGGFGSRINAGSGRPGERGDAMEGDNGGGGAPEVAWSAAGSQEGGSSDPEAEAADSGQAGRRAEGRRAAACSKPPGPVSPAEGGDPTALKLSSSAAGAVLQLLVDIAAQSLCSCGSEMAACRDHAISDGPPVPHGPGDGNTQDMAAEVVAGAFNPQIHGSGDAAVASSAGTCVHRESMGGNREGVGSRGVRDRATDQDGHAALPAAPQSLVLRQGVLSLCGGLCRRLLPAACAGGQPWGRTVAAAIAELAAVSCVGQEAAELDAGEAGEVLVLLRKRLEKEAARVLELVDTYVRKYQ